MMEASKIWYLTNVNPKFKLQNLTPKKNEEGGFVVLNKCNITVGIDHNRKLELS